MNILSLFDGISCGQVALNRAGISVDNYFASEIDKYAIKITQKNFPNTVQLGSVLDWKTWSMPNIDILIGGSPCQGFSKAGDGLNFEDPRSSLFFEFVEILNHYKPKWFLLENVRMKKEWADVISNSLKVEPICIDSALVSAQSRQRLYWTNIPNVTLPEDRGILLKDILENGSVDREKSYCIDANYWKGGSEDYLKRTYSTKSKRQIVKMIQVGNALDIKGHDYLTRVYSVDGKSPSVLAHSGGNTEPKIAIDEIHYRKLTPLECERLQTLPDGYTEGISNTQRYKTIGNGWTVDVIVHILNFIPKEENK